VATEKLEQQDHVDRFLETIAKELPDLDLEVEAIVDRINGINRRIHRLLDETLAEHGLTQGEWRVLGSLTRAGSPYRRSAGELAEHTDISSGAMTNRLDRLEEAGLVRRLPDPNDRRGVLVELTEPGHKLYGESVSAQAAKEALVASALDDDEKQQLNTLLRKIMLELERLGVGKKA
jgi:DNA-binding MarR family transcriptional regulator